jgi:proliferating cell nuclear antigen PCNA
MKETKIKEDDLFKLTISHTNIINFRNLFEVLGQVLHELRMTFIKPDKPICNDSDDSEGENNSDESSDNESSSDSSSEEEKTTKKKSSVKDSNKMNLKKKENTGGIRILELNDHSTIIIHVKLVDFINFDCKYPTYTIGLDPQSLYNFIKNIDKDGKMTISVNETNKGTMNIDLHNKVKQKLCSYMFKLMDLDVKTYNIPPPEFDIIIDEMKTDEFHNMCKEMADGRYLRVTCTEKKIEFRCKSSSGEKKREYENGGSVTISFTNKDDKSAGPKIISEYFDLHNIIMFNKCRTLCSTIQIFLKNKYPMFIRYKVATLGTMQVGFTPVQEDKINKNMNYNDKNDQFYNKPQLKMKDL